MVLRNMAVRGYETIIEDVRGNHVRRLDADDTALPGAYRLRGIASVCRKRRLHSLAVP